MVIEAAAAAPIVIAGRPEGVNEAIARPDPSRACGGGKGLCIAARRLLSGQACWLATTRPFEFRLNYLSPAKLFKRQKSRPSDGGRLTTAKRQESVRLAQKTDALLFARFFDSDRLRRQLQHGRVLTFAQ